MDRAADVDRVILARTIEARDGTRLVTNARTQVQSCLYTLIPSAPADPSVVQRPPVTVRCDRELAVGNQIWVQDECWELVSRHAALEVTPQRSAFPLRDFALASRTHSSPAHTRAGCTNRRPARPSPSGRGSCTLIRRPQLAPFRRRSAAALQGDTDVKANLEGDALRGHRAGDPRPRDQQWPLALHSKTWAES